MPFSMIFGESVIGEGSFVDNFTIIGYPSRSKLKELDRAGTLDLIDSLSEGSKIGRSCIIRSGSVIYEGVTLENEVELGHNVLIRSGSVVGRGSRIGSGVQLDGAVKIGEGCSIQSLSYLPHLTVIGSDVFIGPCVTVTNDKYPPSDALRGVTIEDGAVIGAGAVLIAGITVGRYSVVAAGSVVSRDVPEGKVVMGSPARVVYERRDYELRRSWQK